jgi:hypothetical protein
MWQGALRHPDDAVRSDVVEAIETKRSITIELLYSDQVGRQRTISRFGLVPTGDSWLASLNRHWYLDWDGPRPEDRTLEAAEVILRDQDAAAQRRARASTVDAETDGDGVADVSGQSDVQEVSPTNP